MNEEQNQAGSFFPCLEPECGRVFTQKNALHMHVMRAHGALRGQPRKKQGSTEAVLERKRLYQKRLRDRYYSEGRNSRGQLMPPGWRPRTWASRPRKSHQAVTPAPEQPKPEIWIMVSSGVIHCPHCQKIVGEIKQQEAKTTWHVV